MGGRNDWLDSNTMLSIAVHDNSRSIPVCVVYYHRDNAIPPLMPSRQSFVLSC